MLNKRLNAVRISLFGILQAESIWSGWANIVFFNFSTSVLPVCGLIFLGWNPFAMLLVYLADGMVQSLFMLLRRLIRKSFKDGGFYPAGLGLAVLALPLHFVFVGIFSGLAFLLANIFILPGIGPVPPIPADLNGVAAVAWVAAVYGPILTTEYAAFVSLAAYQIFTFIHNFLLRGEYRERDIDDKAPLSHGILVIHLFAYVIIFFLSLGFFHTIALKTRLTISISACLLFLLYLEVAYLIVKRKAAEPSDTLKSNP